MKLIKALLKGIKWIIVLVICLFSLATFMGKNYGQTLVLLIVGMLLIYWPNIVEKKLGSNWSIVLRTIAVLIIFSFNFTVFKSGPKISIYKSEQNKTELLEIYNGLQAQWPEITSDINIETKYGKVHLLKCGSSENPPLVMIHAASMGAHSWAENLKPLIDKYCIYSIDNIGEGNKSQLNDALVYPNSGKEIADLYASLFDSLQIESAPVFGASNGGYISQVLAYHYPKKVESLSLFCPMGITQLTKGSIFMLTVGSMYPFKFLRDKVTAWGIGTDAYVIKKYGSWFDGIILGTIPSFSQPIPMSSIQKKQMILPVILFLGTKDKIVGDAETAKIKALDYPNIEIEILESSHLIAVEKKEYVNEKIVEFLDKH